MGINKAEILVNRLAVGFIVIVLWGLATGIALLVLGVSFRTDFQGLASGIANFWSFEGFGQIVFWVFSALVLAGIGLIVVRHRKLLSPFKGEQIKDDLPKRTTIVVLLIIAGLITFLLFVANSVLSFIDENLATPSLIELFEALQAGQLMPIIGFVIGAMIVGIIVVAVIGSGVSQNVAEDTGINKI